MRIRDCVIAWAVLAIVRPAVPQTLRPEIPRVWDDEQVARFELPLAQRDRSPRYPNSQQYYALKVRPIYRWYPVYAPGREPAGYRESLKQKEPEIIFDASKLRTKEDWIQAGKLVFETHTSFRPATGSVEVDPGLPVSPEGILPPFRPGNRYYIRKKGVLEVGINACADCHTRVMPDGSFLEGAQGIAPRPLNAAALEGVRASSPDRFEQRVDADWVLFGAPWVITKEAFRKALTREQMIRELGANHPGVFARQGTSRSHPVHVPSLIGVQDLKYLDATGLVRHRSIGDLMRYAVINMGLDTSAHYGDFQPSSKPTPFTSEEGTRYSDEQLYALALYLYALKPPPNPNSFDGRAQRGEQVFREQGCAGCHTPPLYTNNMLTPALGFVIPEDLRKSENILDMSVGSDPTLALKTRRGTGFYKVPSLRGVWFRNGFGHGGQAETLEEWLDPARLGDAYSPKGFHIGPQRITGHEFGLKLPASDRQALIAFLRTL